MLDFTLGDNYQKGDCSPADLIRTLEGSGNNCTGGTHTCWHTSDWGGSAERSLTTLDKYVRVFK